MNLSRESVSSLQGIWMEFTELGKLNSESTNSNVTLRCTKLANPTALCQVHIEVLHVSEGNSCYLHRVNDNRLVKCNIVRNYCTWGNSAADNRMRNSVIFTSAC